MSSVDECIEILEKQIETLSSSLNKLRLQRDSEKFGFAVGDRVEFKRGSRSCSGVVKHVGEFCGKPKLSVEVTQKNGMRRTKTVYHLDNPKKVMT